MNRTTRRTAIPIVLAALTIVLASTAFGNGGPFVVKYPSGDPAAKGILARLDPDLKPARESRLKVLKEDLTITFLDPQFGGRSGDMPLVQVNATYSIENPTDQEIKLDLGFPILRGVYISIVGMGAQEPEVWLTLDKQGVWYETISNSAIFGVIRQRCREIIDQAVEQRPELARLVKAVKEAKPADREAARTALSDFLIGKTKWDHRNVALMVEYASNRFQIPQDVIVVSRGDSYTAYSEWATWPNDLSFSQMSWANLGPLRAIGEQKATQFFAQLASAFDPKASETYEAIFDAWGGDVRERSVDFRTGKVRPRENTVNVADAGRARLLEDGAAYPHPNDPTVYARVDYLDSTTEITEAEKASCRNVLKNLDVVFTFAPMNLLHYSPTFSAHSTKTLAVTYTQYAYADTKDSGSYQIAYVLHPATLWDSFGPINLEVAVPDGIACKASVPTANGGVEERAVRFRGFGEAKHAFFAIHKATLTDKQGELYAAVDAAAWKQKYPPKEIKPVVVGPPR